MYPGRCLTFTPDLPLGLLNDGSLKNAASEATRANSVSSDIYCMLDDYHVSNCFLPPCTEEFDI